MARVSELYYSCRAVVNMGSYESVHVEYGETVVTSPGDDVDRERQRLVRRVTSFVEEKVERLRETARSRTSRGASR